MFLSNLMTAGSHLPALPLAQYGMGSGASTTAQSVDQIFGIINLIALAFFVLVVALMVVFVVKYRARPGHTEQPSPSHNNSLEIIWSVIPILLVALIFFLGFTTFMDMRTPPADAYDIKVLASKWKFVFRYPNGAESEILHVPKDRPIRLVQQSADVLHSMYIPAFRTKMDCVPGRYTYQWFEANKAGEYDLFCAEYCGTQHSQMNSIVKVHETDAAFEKQLDILDTPPENPAEWGEQLWSRKGCKQCHSNDGSVRAGGGPSWKDLFDPDKQPKQFTNAPPADADENYVLESIRKPQAKIRVGYQGVNMSAYPESLVSDDEVNALIAYMKSLSGQYTYVPEEEGEGEADANESPAEDESQGDDAAGEEEAAEAKEETSSDSEADLSEEPTEDDPSDASEAETPDESSDEPSSEAGDETPKPDESGAEEPAAEESSTPETDTASDVNEVGDEE